MSAVGLRVRADLRTSVRFIFAAAITAGLAGGAVLGAAAAGRRTATAFDRYRTAVRAADAFAFVSTPDALDRIARLPAVAEIVRARQVFFTKPDRASLAPEGANAALALPEPMSRLPLDRPKLLEGRFPDPERIDEIAVGFLAAEQYGVRIGERIVLPLPVAGSTLDEAGRGTATIAVRLEATITGIVAVPEFFPPQRVFGDIYLTPRFLREVAPRVMAFPAAIVRLERGQADFQAFQSEVQSFGGSYALVAKAEDIAGPVNRSLRLFGAVLWLFAALAAVSFVLIVGQTFIRMVFLDSLEHPTLRALGMSRAQLFATSMLKTLVIGTGAAAIAVVTAVAISVLGPIGRVARIADPTSGIRVDVFILTIGAALIVVLSAVVPVLPAWRAASARHPAVGTAAPAAGQRPSTMAGLIARPSLPPAVATGIRSALQKGRARTATPVATTLVSAALSLGALVAALTFAASFQHLLSTPRLYGWDWDLGVGNPYVPNGAGEALDALRADSNVVGLAAGTTAVPIDVGGVATNVWALDLIRGSAVPTIIRGRWPRRDGEIALGPKVLRRLSVPLDTNVMIGFAGLRTPMRVVGEALFPVGAYQLTGTLGEGAGMTFSQFRRLSPRDAANLVTVRLAPGTDVSDLIRRVTVAGGPNLEIERARGSNDLEDLERAKGLPLALAGMLALAGASAVAHALVASVRRRRRDLAVLKTLGFSRSQIFGSVAAQATTFALLAVAFGIPAGIIAGTNLWSVFATRTLATLSVPVVPALAVALVIPGALLTANLVALVPARTAARIQAAVALRSE